MSYNLCIYYFNRWADPQTHSKNGRTIVRPNASIFRQFPAEVGVVGRNCIMSTGGFDGDAEGDAEGEADSESEGDADGDVVLTTPDIA